MSPTADLQIEADFFAQLMNDLVAVAYFGPHSTDLPVSVFFGSLTNDLICTANFSPYSSDLICTTYLGPVSQFNDLITVAQLGIFTSDLPTNVNFTAIPTNHADLTSYAIFKYSADLASNAYFIGAGINNLISRATFVYQTSINSTATFVNNATQDLPCLAFFGIFHKDLISELTFYQYGLNDFNAAITIRPYQPPNNLQFSNSNDFNASIFIRNYIYASLPSSATFVQSAYANFRGGIIINNSYFGVGGATVTVINNATKQKYTTTSDATGFFHVDGLVPGSYEVIVSLAGTAIHPSSTNVTITNANITVYFQSGDTFTSQSGLVVPLPPPPSMCHVNPAGPIGYSIEGFIVQNISNSFTPVIVTAANEDDAKAFRQTFGNNIGGGR